MRKMGLVLSLICTGLFLAPDRSPCAGDPHLGFRRRRRRQSVLAHGALQDVRRLDRQDGCVRRDQLPRPGRIRLRDHHQVVRDHLRLYRRRHYLAHHDGHHGQRSRRLRLPERARSRRHRVRGLRRQLPERRLPDPSQLHHPRLRRGRQRLWSPLRAVVERRAERPGLDIRGRRNRRNRRRHLRAASGTPVVTVAISNTHTVSNGFGIRTDSSLMTGGSISTSIMDSESSVTPMPASPPSALLQAASPTR